MSWPSSGLLDSMKAHWMPHIQNARKIWVTSRMFGRQPVTHTITSTVGGSSTLQTVSTVSILSRAKERPAPLMLFMVLVMPRCGACFLFLGEKNALEFFREFGVNYKTLTVFPTTCSRIARLPQVRMAVLFVPLWNRRAVAKWYLHFWRDRTRWRSPHGNWWCTEKEESHQFHWFKSGSDINSIPWLPVRVPARPHVRFLPLHFEPTAMLHYALSPDCADSTRSCRTPSVRPIGIRWAERQSR